MEVLLSERWSGKVEYLYLDTGNVTLNPGGMTVTGKLRDQVARIGLNYHF